MLPRSSMMRPSWHDSAPTEENARAPVPCPFCGRALAVWAAPDAHAAQVWVKCKNPACKREVEIKL